MTRKTMRSRLEARLIADGRLSPKTPKSSQSVTSGNERLYALGRLKVGEKNRTEANYESTVLQPAMIAGEIVWYRFEGLKLRLADNTFYTPDYAVMRSDGLIEVHEVKGFWTDDARVKIKVAAEQYPFRFIAVRALPKKNGGGWEREVFE
ncbi:DUF1064 domain-containing protein [Sphingobium yanoikuyae]|nr:DUF1064 domain-containing protein [Sphingobium yanoikuyae]